MNKKISLQGVLNIGLLWLIGIVGWLSCQLAESIQALAKPAMSFNEWLVERGEAIINSDPDLQELYKEMSDEDEGDV